jgi:hypothetical protein
MKPLRILVVTAALAAVQACASLPQIGRLIQPVRFEADERGSEVRLMSPRSGDPLGAAGIRLWTRVSNPNPFGLTLSTIRATLLLEDTRAATGDFPLGLPLEARQESVVPLDLTVSFSDVPALATLLRRSSSAQPLRYSVEGTFGVEVGRLGSPTFGPMTLFSGDLRAPSLGR